MSFNFEFPDYGKREACVAACPSKREGKQVTITAAELGGTSREDLQVYLSREGNTVRVLNVLGTKLGGFPRQVGKDVREAIIAVLDPKIDTLLPKPEDVMHLDEDGNYHIEL